MNKSIKLKTYNENRRSFSRINNIYSSLIIADSLPSFKKKSHTPEKSNKKLFAISIIWEYGNVNTPIDEPP